MKKHLFFYTKIFNSYPITEKDEPPDDEHPPKDEVDEKATVPAVSAPNREPSFEEEREYQPEEAIVPAVSAPSFEANNDLNPPSLFWFEPNNEINENVLFIVLLLKSSNVLYLYKNFF